MNDTVFSLRQVELIKEIMSNGLVAVYCDPKVSEKEFKDLCSRADFDIGKWRQENGMSHLPENIYEDDNDKYDYDQNDDNQFGG